VNDIGEPTVPGLGVLVNEAVNIEEFVTVIVVLALVFDNRALFVRVRFT